MHIDAQVSNLGISKGNVCPLVVLNAERHVVRSNFRIDTTLMFNDCGRRLRRRVRVCWREAGFFCPSPAALRGGLFPRGDRVAAGRGDVPATRPPGNKSRS